nr:ABC transporter permease [Phosphitispora fastidiosa]
MHNIALNNIRRRKAKLAFLVAGMVIGIATIVVLFTVTGAMEKEISDKFDQIGSNMTIVPRTEALSTSYEGISASDIAGGVRQMTMEDVARIGTIKNKENIAVVSPKLLETLQVDDKNMTVMGVRFAEELKMKRWWELDGRAPGTPDEVLLGFRAAERLGKRPGETVVINGADYKVSGIIRETGSQEDSIVLADLRSLQQLSGKTGAVSFIEVAALCYTCPIEEITAQISEKLPGTKVSAIREVVQARQDFVDRFSQLGISVSVIVLVIGSLVVLTTMMSAVNERTREIGIFRAIGFRKSHVIGIILMEAGFISIIGGLLGYLAGMAGARVAAPLIAKMEVAVPWDLQIGLMAMGVAVIMGLAAGLLPAFRAARQDPVEALRFI